MAWFKKEPLVSTKEPRPRIPEGLWIKCDNCKEIIYKQELEKNLHVCPRCQHHFRMSARARIDLVVDPDSFQERHAMLRSLDPLHFKDQKSYPDRIRAAQKATGMEDALLAGVATIGGYRVSICALEFAFMGGSMGSVVGEKVTRAAEEAAAERIPFIAAACSGGARMQESALSLMQLAKVSGALARLGRLRLPYIAILADPTTGGVTASFAMLGDIAIAEPNALIGFAGPRVIQDTIRQELPPGFQRSEFLLNHGFLDMIVERRNLRPTLIQLLQFFCDTSASPSGS